MKVGRGGGWRGIRGKTRASPQSVRRLALPVIAVSAEYRCSARAKRKQVNNDLSKGTSSKKENQEVE